MLSCLPSMKSGAEVLVTEPQIGRPELSNSDGVNPPWNHPQLMLFRLSRSPMLTPFIEAVVPPGVPSLLSGVPELEHLSKSGSASPVILPLSVLFLRRPTGAGPL